MQTTAPTLTTATREKLRQVALRAADGAGIIRRSDRALVDRHRKQLAAEDPALLRFFDRQRAA